VYGFHFHTAVFTNLTRDHLDFHRTMEEYAMAKRMLFAPSDGPAPRWVVLNADDPASQGMMPPAGSRVLWYGLSEDVGSKNGLRNGLHNALRAENIRSGFDGLHFDLIYEGARQPVESELIGRMNVQNILAAAGAGLSYGLDLAAIARGVRACPPVPGRFERVDCGQPFLVVVDYAHTDDALRNLLATAKELNPDGRILTLFGCGGDRDRTKRPIMGEVAGQVSDVVVLTSDNPRSEDPLLIINDVIVGVQRTKAKLFIEADRQKAIEKVMDEARAGDIVVLAGKGHETYQVLRDRTIEFDDREVARKVLRRHGFGGD
jgi:UDP-N-acetylmuramoyl-L-alanyl-D-glutamate--2,6-diaminopimelate ligase